MDKYYYLGKHIKTLDKDIYPQPIDEGHDELTQQCIKNLVEPIQDEIATVMDIGCGQGIAQPHFNALGIKWRGLVKGQEDYRVCKQKGLPVVKRDMTLTKLKTRAYDLVFARHVLEHSPMPLLSLMEWWRISKRYLLIVLPNPHTEIIGGVNHYYMLGIDQWQVLFKNSAWELVKHDYESTKELRYLMVKGDGRHDYYNHPLV